LTRDGGVSPTSLKRSVQKLATTNVGLIRNRVGLEKTQAVLAEYRQDAIPKMAAYRGTRVLNREWMETIELRNMLDVVEAMSAAALARCETRGAHYRQDFPERNDEEWLANLYVRRSGTDVTVEKRSLVGVGPDDPVAKPTGVRS
jgi:succinate dehydrogenase/fumarate reductase flavoprotein subunit